MTYIKDHLLYSHKYGLQNQELSFSQWQAIITLMFKKEDRHRLQNYRLISLSNLDYNIFVFVLANRLHQILDHIISKEQTAYVKSWFLGENMEDINDYASRMNIPGLILLLDFQKTFDSLEWNFMYQVLQKFVFGPAFCSFIKSIYKHPLASIKVNGYLTKYINNNKRIKQGCPLSALIFIICTNFLAISI